MAERRLTHVHVAGGRGFLGRAVVRALGARAAGVAVTTSGREALAPEVGATVDVLVWCAGSRVGTSDELLDVHDRAPRAMLAELPGLRAVVYVSSGEVYGAGAVPYLEESPRRGTSSYALAKIAGEDGLAREGARRGLRVAIARPSVVYGPEQAGDQLVPQALWHLANGVPLALTAGEQTRDWIFVDDAAAMIARLARGEHYGCFNVASGVERSVRDVLGQAAALFGPSSNALLRWGARPYRSGEPMRYVLSTAQARRKLGLVAATPLHEGLGRCAAALLFAKERAG
jgi:nucleoside-diphosphate-sugar epimerase